MSLESIRARNEAEKKAGVTRTYSHAKKAKGGHAAAPARALPVLTDCVHGGTDDDITERCPSCSGGAKHVRECGLNPAGVTWEPQGRLMSCRQCQAEGLGYVPANAHPNVLAADDFARALPPYPEGRFSGRGIVVCGGGAYWPSVYVTVRMLRHVGCGLPVQVWYLGGGERDPRYADLLAPLGVECVDSLAHPAAAATRGLTGFPDPTGRNGPTHPPFQLKSFAVLNSPFAEALSLDADNYPCADPTVLFDDLRYRQTGAVFWPDLAMTDGWTKWADWGVTPRGPAVGLEVGQYLIDKRAAWGPLNLMRWYDDRGDWCYGWGERFDHGDKGPPRVAFAKLKREYTMFTTHADWREIAFVQPGPDGVTPAFVHRCLSKMVLDPTAFPSSPQKAPNQRAGLPLEEVAFGFLDDLRRALR